MIEPSQIIACVAADYRTTPALIRSGNRSGDVCDARAMAMYLCTELTALSLPSIGRALGGKHHTTVLAARDRMRRRVPLEAKLQESIARIKQAIESGNIEFARAPESIRERIIELGSECKTLGQRIREIYGELREARNLLDRAAGVGTK